MNSRIPAVNRLDPKIVALIEELAEKKAREKVDSLQAARDEKTIRMVMKAFTVRNNDLHGIGAKRAARLIEAVNRDMATEDPEEVWRHIDERLAQIGLEFYDKEEY